MPSKDYCKNALKRSTVRVPPEDYCKCPHRSPVRVPSEIYCKNALRDKSVMNTAPCHIVGHIIAVLKLHWLPTHQRIHEITQISYQITPRDPPFQHKILLCWGLFTSCLGAFNQLLLPVPKFPISLPSRHNTRLILLPESITEPSISEWIMNIWCCCYAFI